MKTSELFEKEINLIKNDHLKNIVKNTLDESPECIQTIPSSSSGRILFLIGSVTVSSTSIISS